MNLRLASIVCLLLILNSCKSIQGVSSHENSSGKALSKKGDPQFLNNVSITPGEKKNNYTYNKHDQPGSKKSFESSNASSSFNLENADWLQIKYAIIMDMPVEQLNNLPLLQQVDHWWGTRYCLGGDDESCIDCSAFTQVILRNVYGVEVPRTAREQYSFSTHIKDTELQEGDLIFFKSRHAISHVGLYMGNYKFVHATTSGGVTISDLSDDYWSKKYAGARRIEQ